MPVKKTETETGVEVDESVVELLAAAEAATEDNPNPLRRAANFVVAHKFGLTAVAAFMAGVAAASLVDFDEDDGDEDED
jgi:hypothetical protein